jgi:hypothetical protein
VGRSPITGGFHMLRTLAIVAAFVLAAGSASAAGTPHLDAKGKCRDDKGYVTQTLCAAPAASAKAPNCKKGKPCGNSCIAKDKECHIK